MRAASALLTSILALSASFPHATFRYDLLHSIRRSTDTCRVCYGDDCINMSEARCEYYVEADEVMEKDEEAGEISVVDEMMSDLTQQAVMSWSVDKCIPFISYYTNCNKENICVGCKTCYCKDPGTWTCARVQRCRPEVATKINHRTLLMVIEKLKDLSVENSKRKKRLVKQVSKKPEMKHIGLLDIAEWMYEIKPNTGVELPKPAPSNNVAVAGNKNYSTENSTQFNTNSNKPTENEYLGFEEVLKNIATEDLKTAKSQLKDNIFTGYDYMDFDEHKADNKTEPFLSVLNAIEEGRDVTESTDGTTLVVNLFPRENTNVYDDYNGTDNVDTNEIYNIIYKEDNNTIDTSNYRMELEPVKIMKRDIISITSLNNTTQDNSHTTATLETTTNKETDLKNNVLLPLTTIIDDKQNEVKELLQIKENLMHIMNIYYNNTELNITKDLEKINGSTYFSIYKLDLFPKIHENLRRNNLNFLDKLLYKLKRDIYEVLRDVASIQKISNTHDLPDDLKMLIRSMKYYVNKQGSIRNFKKKDIQLERINDDTRRSQVTLVESTTPKSIKRQLIDILEVLDEETSQSNNALANLSKFPKKIMKRVIKQNYVDEDALVGLKISDNEYNLTTDLRTIGKAWPVMIENLATSPQHEKIYAMKLLHFALASDIVKISDAISLINFAHSRRMTPIEIPIAEQLLENINSGLTSIKNKVETLIQYHTTRKKKMLRQNVDIVKKQNKKESFLKRLRNMLRNSKKHILSFTKKKIPESEIFQAIPKKKPNEPAEKQISKDEQTMLRWQANFNISRRKKRDLASHVSSMKKRMKSIIPKYLRGKINPAIEKQKRISVTKKKIEKQKNHVTTVKAIKKDHLEAE